MGIRRTGQASFADLMADHGPETALDDLGALADWSGFEGLVAHLRRAEGPGKPGHAPLLMFKALILASLYGLSDRQLELAIRDRLSFRRFLGLSLADAAPDHTVICRFRNALVAEDLMEKLFAELDRQLEAAGLMVKKGTMLDATLIATGLRALQRRARRPAIRMRPLPGARARQARPTATRRMSASTRAPASSVSSRRRRPTSTTPCRRTS